MSFKSFVYHAHQEARSQGLSDLQRSHVYELSAAAFGFGSYAALCDEHIFSAYQYDSKASQPNETAIQHRALALGFAAEAANYIAEILNSKIVEKNLSAIDLRRLITHLRAGDFYYYSALGDEIEGLDEVEDLRSNEALCSDLASAKDNALASYALALLCEPEELHPTEGQYWHSRALQGESLKGAALAFATEYEEAVRRVGSYREHLQRAASLGCQEASFDLARQFGDPTFFQSGLEEIDLPPSWIAEVAEDIGLDDAAHRWLTIAARTGDVDAMRSLIETYDAADAMKCWTWLHLSSLLNEDLTRDRYVAINPDGSEYDDDVGGPAEVGGQEGIKIPKLPPELDAQALHSAQLLLAQIDTEL